MSIADRLSTLRARIAEAARAAARDPAAITLVAVSKTHPAEAVAEALAAGQAVFGENRVQEAAAKFPGLRAAHPGLRLHLIGPLQTNKARDAVRLFDRIESLDRPKLADALAAAIAREGRAPDCLIQVNTGREAQKAGCPPEDAEALLVHAQGLGLPVAGLMCIPPAEDDPAPHFALLAGMARRFGLDVLSMGMSGDYPAAIAAGATHVRVGSAIFGQRS